MSAPITLPDTTSCAPLQAIPPGRYLAVVIDSDMKDIRAGTGRYLQLAFEVTDGAYTGHVIFYRLCIEHVDPFTARIARKALAAVSEAAGVPQPKDSAELHDIPVFIDVACEKKPDGRIVNTVAGVAKASASDRQVSTRIH